MQYTLSQEGHGNRIQPHVPFFTSSQDQNDASDDEFEVSMNHSR